MMHVVTYGGTLHLHLSCWTLEKGMHQMWQMGGRPAAMTAAKGSLVTCIPCCTMRVPIAVCS